MKRTIPVILLCAVLMTGCCEDYYDYGTPETTQTESAEESTFTEDISTESETITEEGSDRIFPEDQLLYKLGRMFQRGLGADIDIPRAADLFWQAAHYRNHWAEYQLGKLYLFGADGITPDREQAVDWLTRSAEDGNEYAEQMLRRMEDYQNRMLTDTVFGLFLNIGRLIEDNYDRTGRVIQSRVDSKLRRAIRRRKQELGIKGDSLAEIKY